MARWAMLRRAHHYQAFVLAAETGSITETAARLDLPRPTVSRQIAGLEAELGVALLHRTTRRVSPTPAGQRLLERVRPLIDAWTRAEDELRAESSEVRGAVRISALPLVTGELVDVCGALRERHPALQIEIVANVRLVDLRTEGFDVAIWAGDPRDHDLIQRQLAVGHVGLVASPAYLARAGTPTSADDLAGHALLRGHDYRGRPRVWWPLVDGGRVRVDGGFVSNDHTLLHAAAIAGHGIALLADLTCHAALADGRLVRVLPEVGHGAALRVIFAQRTGMPAPVRVFVDAVFEHFQAHPVLGRR